MAQKKEQAQDAYTHFKMKVGTSTYIRMRTTDESVVAKLAKALGKEAVVQRKNEEGRYTTI